MPLPVLSVVIPVYNEAGNIEAVAREALEKLAPLRDFEILLVDDGSTDETGKLLDRLTEGDARLRVLHHEKRSGKSAGLRTGIAAASAIWVATMDGDGQNDPADIVRMTREVNLAAVDRIGLVAGIRLNRQDRASRKFASKFANGLRRALLNDDCPDTACGLKLIQRELFLSLPFFDALHRYLPALVRRRGYATVNVEANDRPRTSGASKYTNIGRAAAGVVDLFGVIWLLRRATWPKVINRRG